MKKRILIFSTAYHPFIGGAEVALKEITDRIEEYDFHMITALMDRKLPRIERVGKIIVHRIGLGIPLLDKFYLALWGYKSALKLHQRYNYVCLWSLMASYCGFAARKFKLKTDIPFLLTLQEGDPFDYILKKVRLVKKQFYQIFQLADGLQAISTYLLEWGKVMGFRGSVSRVIPNGVDVSRFTKEYPNQEIQEIRNNFGFPDHAIILVTASRLVEKNDIERVVRALSLLPEKVCFVICGDGKQMNFLNTLVNDLELEKRVIFLGGKNHDELPKIFKASDIFIRPSVTEGLGNSFLEAMAVGLPTVGTMVGGIPDFLKDGETGFVCEVKNEKSIAESILRILKLDDTKIDEIHDNALKMIQGIYNWDSIVLHMKKLFSYLLNHEKSSFN